jgi:SAM-dependent methyltransferase
MNAPVSPAPQPPLHSRHTFFGWRAFQLCKGRGIEVGALSKPFDLDAEVEYADVLPTEEMAQAIAGSEGDHDLERLVPVTHVLKPPFFNFTEVPNVSRDFVVSSHAVEHHPNPVHALAEYLRVVRPGGHVYSVIPNMHATWDDRRQVTPPEYLWRRYLDFQFDYPEQRALEIAHMSKHFDAGIQPGSEAAMTAVANARLGELHLFTYTPESVLELLRLAKDVLRARLVYFNVAGPHIHFALARTTVHGA